MKRPTISVIIPVQNGGENFRRCLDSLRQSSRQPDDLIVVVDGDIDGSWEVAKEFKAKVVRYDSAAGIAHARNRGAQSAQADLLFFISADVTVGCHTILDIEKAFQQDINLAALVGSYDDQPGADNFLSQYKTLFLHYLHQISSEKASAFWGTCGAIRSEVFKAVGGFDERYRQPYVEDFELGYRLKRGGYTMRLARHIQVKHLKCWRPDSLIQAEIFHQILPRTKLILSQGQSMNDFSLEGTSRLSVLLSFVALLCLLGGFANALLWIIAIATMLGLLVINQRVYRFFWHKRGALFAFRAVLWHWFYLLYGGAAFAYGTATYRWRQLSTSVD
ncbi:glycosyltransferase family 2 protein [Nodosilinea nodulosa]|uniref:glycosyltransferase family 2 protein n=1 Tax=Nodosilinea nodulosa TaxID=416001 RepID=UPI0004753FB6|nr:glycosyltransferase [Nodosilinea nodulosa]